MTTKRNRKAKNVLVVNMSEALVVETVAAPEVDLDALLATLGTEDEAGEEIIEAADTVAEPDAIIESAMEAAAEVIEREEMYADLNEGKADEPTSEADTPTVVTKEKKVRAKKAAGEPKAPKAAKTPKEPKPEAEPKEPRVTFRGAGNSRSSVLDYRLKGKANDFLVLELSDAELGTIELEAKIRETRDQLDNTVAEKVSEKALMLLRDLSAGVAIKNDVLATAFKVMKRDGFLTSGDKGNLQLALRERLSMGTSRSQANQMFMLFPFLKITVKSEKGQQIANPNSALLPLCNASLGLI